MIAIVACNCGNALPTAYKFLQQFIEKWMDVPIHQGRDKASEFLAQFADYQIGEKSPHELSKFLTKVSRYIVVVGWDDESFDWSDIGHGGIKELADAELIVERFA